MIIIRVSFYPGYDPSWKKIKVITNIDLYDYDYEIFIGNNRQLGLSWLKENDIEPFLDQEYGPDNKSHILANVTEEFIALQLLMLEPR